MVFATNGKENQWQEKDRSAKRPETECRNATSCAAGIRAGFGKLRANKASRPAKLGLTHFTDFSRNAKHETRACINDYECLVTFLNQSLFVPNETAVWPRFLNNVNAAELQYPGWLRKLLTHPVQGLENYAEMIGLLTEPKAPSRCIVKLPQSEVP